MKFTVFRANNGWIVIVGDHDYLAKTDAKACFVFTSTQAMAQWLAAQASSR